MPETKPHRRVNDILLGPLERPALHWLAAHMPGWVTPDLLTTTGFLGSVIIFLSYCLTYFDKNFLWLASVGFAINWFGDSLDGTLARYRDIQRPNYGFFVDHTVDAASEVLVFLGLGLSPYVRLDIACLALIGYLLMSILVFISTYVKGEFKLSCARLGPTEIRLIAILANALVYFIGNPVVHAGVFAATVYDVLAAVIAALLMISFAFSTIRQAVQLSKLETPGRQLVIQRPAR